MNKLPPLTSAFSTLPLTDKCMKKHYPIYDLNTHSMRNVLQCRKAWVIDIQPHIGTQTFHKATVININFISWFLTYCSMVTLQSRKILWCLIWTWYTKTYAYTMCSYACAQIQRQKLLNIGRCNFRSISWLWPADTPAKKTWSHLNNLKWW